jgi:hypothetical protein
MELRIPSMGIVKYLSPIIILGAKYESSHSIIGTSTYARSFLFGATLVLEN